MNAQDKCPMCGKPLEATQINLTTAVFLCRDLKCPYPVNGQCYVVQRDIKDVKKPIDLKAALEKMAEIPKQTSETLFDVTDLDGLLDVYLKDERGCEFKEEASGKSENVPTESGSQNDFKPDMDFLLELLN